MMQQSRWSTTEKDGLLREVLARLRARGISSAWTDSLQPQSDLFNEATRLMHDAAFRDSMMSYLRRRTTVTRAVEMLVTTMAMAARADWKAVPAPSTGVAARGSLIGRWLPTFLAIDGPIGRVLREAESPLVPRFGPDQPFLTAARDLLGHKDFYRMRCALAHWSFHWEVVGTDSYLVAYDWDTDLPTVKLHQGEADAFHLAAFSFIEVLNDVFIVPRAEPLIKERHDGEEA